MADKQWRSGDTKQGRNYNGTFRKVGKGPTPAEEIDALLTTIASMKQDIAEAEDRGDKGWAAIRKGHLETNLRRLEVLSCTPKEADGIVSEWLGEVGR